MSRTKGTLGLSSNIEPSMNAPLDGREVVGLVSDLTASGTFPYFYEGMQVYVKENKKTYKLIGANPTALVNWQESGTEIVIDDTPTSGSNNPVSSDGVYDALSGKADLVDGKIPAAQLPVGFDNYDEYNNLSSFPIPGESEKIYVAKDTELTYRWTGSAYVPVGGGGVALGETSSTAYRGDRGKIAYDDSQANKGAIGTLANLATTVKTNLVTAINEIKNSLTSVATSGSFNDLVNRPTKEVTDIDTITPLPQTPVKLLTVANKIDKANIYSTAEQIVGQWVNGKPLYQRTFSGLMPTANTSEDLKIFSVDLSSCMIKNIKAVGTCSNGTFTLDNNCYTGTNGIFIVFTQKDGIYINSKGYLRTSVTDVLEVTIQYTKSTDSAMPVGTDTDYSTSEKIVGSWVDGKPIYQKTFYSSSLPNNSQASLGTISNIDTLVYMYGMFKQTVSGSVYQLPLVFCQPGSSISSLAITIFMENNNVIIATGTDRRDAIGYVTVQYTKTTD